jgi:hypothetical protein
MKNLNSYFIAIISWTLSAFSLAAASTMCSGVFADAITTHGASGKILMPGFDPALAEVAIGSPNAEQKADIVNSPDFDFSANSIMYAWSGFASDPSGWGDAASIPSSSRNTCDSAVDTSSYDCDASTSSETSLTLPSFETSSSTSTLTLDMNWGTSQYEISYFDGTSTTTGDSIWGNDPSETACDFVSVSVKSGGTLQLSDAYCDEYHIDTVSAISSFSGDSTLLLDSGNFWIETWDMGDGAINWGADVYVVEPGDAYYYNRLMISSGDKATVYVLNDMSVKGLSLLNTSAIDTPETTSKLTLINYGDLTMEPGAQISAIVYSGENTYLKSGSATSSLDIASFCDTDGTNKGYFDRCTRTQIWGALTAQNVGMDVFTAITYDSAAVDASGMTALCPSASVSVDHFSIAPASTSVNACDGAVDISISAVDNSGSVITDYTGTIDLEAIYDGLAVQGTWAAQGGAGGTLTVSGTGEASYEFVVADNGVALLTLLVTDANISVSPDVININVEDQSDGSITETSGVAVAGDDSGITFNECASSFNFSLPAEVVSCSNASVVITALDDSGAALLSYDELINITTSTSNGDWSNVSSNGTFTPGSSDSGTANYQFLSADNGTITLSLANTNLEELTVASVQNSDTSINATSASINFNDAGFILIDNSTELEVDENTLLTAGVNSSAYAWKAVKTNTTTQVCDSYFPASGSRTLALGSQCTDPNSCLASQQLNLSWNNNSSFSGIANPQNQEASADTTSRSTNFSANSKTDPLYLKYYDVGKIKFTVSHTLSGGESLDGEKSFVVQPYALSVSSVAVNPATGVTANASVGTYVTAGSDFSFEITALAQDSAGTGTQVSANFGNETAAQTFSYSHSVIAPAVPASNGTFTASSPSKSSGKYSVVDAAFTEVGIIELTVSLDNYLGDSAADLSVNENFGRFYPDFFSAEVLNTQSTPTNEIKLANINSSCSIPFTYQGQGVNFSNNYHPEITLTAKNVADNEVLNYGVDSDWWKLNGQSFDFADKVSAANSSGFIAADSLSILNSDITHTFSSLDNTVTLENATAFWNKRPSPDSNDGSKAMQVDITFDSTAFVDSDGVCIGGNTSDANCNDVVISNIAGISLSYGRIVMENASGSELNPLYMPLIFQYYDASVYGFVTNESDNCSINLINTSDFDVDQHNGDDVLEASEVTFGSITEQGYLVINAPGAEGVGSVKISLGLDSLISGDDLSYLKYNIDGDNDFENPQAQATFGIWQGRKKDGETRSKLLHIQRSFR